MTVFEIIVTILVVVTILVMSVAVAYETVPMSKTPEWLEDLHHFIFR